MQEENEELIVEIVDINEVNYPQIGTPQSQPTHSVFKILRAFALAGTLLAPLTGAPSFEKSPKEKSPVLSLIPEAHADDKVTINWSETVHVPARFYLLLDLANEWKNTYQDEYKNKVKQYLQQGYSIDDAADKAAQDMENQLNSMYSSYLVEWDIKVINTTQNGNQYTVTTVSYTHLTLPTKA